VREPDTLNFERFQEQNIMASSALYSLAFGIGVASHIFWFNGREHHFYGSSYVATTLFILAGGTSALCKGYGLPLREAFASTSTIVASILAGLYTSLIIYRLFLNPLNIFPGPYWVRLGNLAWSSQLTNFDSYYKLKALHDKHGDIVRIGSHDLSIIDPEGMEISFGVKAQCTPLAPKPCTINAAGYGRPRSQIRH
jgi:hypothetical protein